MPVNGELLQQFRALERNTAGTDSPDDLSAFTTIPEVLAYLATCVRAGGEIDEADAVELAADDLGRDDLAEAHTILRRLGYVAVADRLRLMARRKGRTKVS